MDNNETRVCSRCNTEKSIAFFYKRERVCRECRNIRVRENYSNMDNKKKDVIRKKAREKSRNLTTEQVENRNNRMYHYYRKDPVKNIYEHAKRRAREKGYLFDIEISDVIIPDVCPVLGIPLMIGDGYQTHNSPTLDRICNDKGYVKGNVQVISWRANSLKRDANIEEIRSILEYMENMVKSTH